MSDLQVNFSLATQTGKKKRKSNTLKAFSKLKYYNSSKRLGQHKNEVRSWEENKNCFLG